MSLRRLALKIGVTIAGPLVILAGVAMLVLPGPGLVVIAAGFGLLAAEYPWARRLVVAGGHVLRRLKELAFPQGGSPTRKLTGLVVAGGHVLRRLKELAFPQGGSPTRKLTGLLATGAAVVASTLATGAITAYVASVLVL